MRCFKGFNLSDNNYLLKSGASVCMWELKSTEMRRSTLYSDFNKFLMSKVWFNF
jgi:hypothetical protein